MELRKKGPDKLMGYGSKHRVHTRIYFSTPLIIGE